jgi:hypothetical protein
VLCDDLVDSQTDLFNLLTQKIDRITGRQIERCGEQTPLPFNLFPKRLPEQRAFVQPFTSRSFAPGQPVAQRFDMTEAVARNLFATRCQAIKELLQFIIRQRDGAQHRQQALAHDIAGLYRAYVCLLYAPPAHESQV